MLQNKHSALDIMDRFKCSRQIMTVPKKKGWLEMMSSNNRLSFNFYTPETKEVSQLINITYPCYNCSCSETGGELTLYLWKQRRLQVLISKKDSTLEILIPCKMLPEIMMVPLKCMAACTPLKLEYALKRNICQIHWQSCKSCSEINTVSAKEWMTTTNFVK